MSQPKVKFNDLSAADFKLFFKKTLKNATNKQAFLLIAWGIIYPSRLIIVLKNVYNGTALKFAIKYAKTNKK